MAGGYTGGEYWTFDQLVASTNVETNRPDLVDETKNALVAAIMQLHTYKGNFFYKDIVTGQGTFDTDGTAQQQYVWTLDTTTFPRYRSLCFFRKWDPNYAKYELNPTILPPLSGVQYGGGFPLNPQLALKELTILSPADLIDSYNTEKVDVCYQAGSVLNIKSSTPLSQFQIGYYSYPKIDLANNFAGLDSWIVREYPWAVIYLAAAAMYAKTGDAESSAVYGSPPDSEGNGGGLAWQHIQAMVNSNIVATGE